MAKSYFRNVIEQAEEKIRKGDVNVKHVPISQTSSKSVAQNVQSQQRQETGREKTEKENKKKAAEETTSAVDAYDEIVRNARAKMDGNDMAMKEAAAVNATAGRQYAGADQRLAAGQNNENVKAFDNLMDQIQSEELAKRDKAIADAQSERDRILQDRIKVQDNLQKEFDSANLYDPNLDINTIAGINAWQRNYRDIQDGERSLRAIQTQARNEKQQIKDTVTTAKYENSVKGKMPSVADDELPRDIQQAIKLRNGDVPFGEQVSTKAMAAKNMTDEQLNTYKVLYSEDKDKAEEYLDALTEGLNAQLGREWAERIEGLNGVGRAAAIGASAFNSGLEGALRNPTQWLSDEALKTTPIQYAVSEESQNVGNFGRQTIGALQSVGNMLPSVLLSMAGGAVTPFAGKALGSAAMFASAGGAAKTQALREGADNKQATAYGALVGASEVALQNVLGGVVGLTGVTTDLANAKLMSAVSKIDNAFLRTVSGAAGTYLIDALGEVTEEELQNYLEPLFAQVCYGKEMELPTGQDFWDTLVSTLLSTAIMNGSNAAITDTQLASLGKMISDGEAQSDIIQYALSLDEDSAAYKLAQQYERYKSVTNVEMGRLVQAVYQNGADMAQTMTAAGQTAAIDQTGDTAAQIPGQAQTEQELIVPEQIPGQAQDQSEAEISAQNAIDQQTAGPDQTAADMNTPPAGTTDRNMEQTVGMLAAENPEAYAAMQQRIISALNFGNPETDMNVRRAGGEQQLADDISISGMNMTPEEFNATWGPLLNDADQVKPTWGELQGTYPAQQTVTTASISAEVPTETADQTAVSQTAETAEIERMTGERLTNVEARNVQLTEEKAQEIARINRTAKALGVNVIVDENVPENGYYDRATGNIYINPNTDRAVFQVFKHELTHSISGTKSWAKFSEYVLNEVSKNYNMDQIREGFHDDYDALYRDQVLRRLGDNADEQSIQNALDAMIDEEIVAEWVGDNLFDNEKAVNDLVKNSRSTASQILTWIRDTLDRLTGRIDADTAALRKAERMFSRALGEESRAGQDETGDVRYSVDIPEDGKPMTPADEIQYSLKNNEKYFTAAEKYNNSNITRYADKTTGAKEKHVSDSVMQKAKADREYIKGLMTRTLPDGTKMEDYLPPDVLKGLNPGNTRYSNGSYGVSEDNTTVCTRMIANEFVLDRVADRLGRPLNVDDCVKVSQMFMQWVDKAQCTYCYEAQDRYARREFLNRYLDERDSAIEDLRSGMDYDEALDRYLHGRKPSDEMKARFAMFDKIARGEIKGITSADISSARKVEQTLKAHPELTDQIKDALKYAQSASWGKKNVNYTAYNGHILKWTQDFVDNLNEHFGMRMYSYSDFSPAFILENMQMITDASVKGLKVLAYTKELDFVRIFAKTGANINVSTYGYLGDDGQVHMDGMQGADWTEARKLRAENPNVGIIFVATNDKIVEWALAQDWIDVVIPFHTVRTDMITEYFDWKNYKGSQEDVKMEDWTTVNKSLTDRGLPGLKSSIDPPQHQNDLQTYLRALEENHLRPRFEQWIKDPNYMKLVNETRQSDAQTKPVQPIFDTAVAEQALDTMVKRGGYEYESFGAGSDVLEDVADELADAYVNNGGLEWSVEHGKLNFNGTEGYSSGSYQYSTGRGLDQYRKTYAEKLTAQNASEQSPEEIDAVKEMILDEDSNPAVSREFSLDEADLAQHIVKINTNPGKRVSYYNQTLDRAIDTAAGKNTEVKKWLEDNLSRPLYDSTGKYATQVTERVTALKTDVVEGLGIKKGSRESAAIMWLGEGQRITGIDQEGRPEYEKYSLEDLKRDFPKKWQDIQKAERWFRQQYDQYVDEINAARKRIYPTAEEDAKAKVTRAMSEARLAAYDYGRAMDAATANPSDTGLREFAQQMGEKLAEAQENLRNVQKAYDSGELLRNKRLKPRKDYFRHFTEMQAETFPSLLQSLKNSIDIDPMLVGVSDFTQPKSKWQGIFQKRGNGAYVEDAVGGLLKYIPQAEFAVNVDPVIASNRGFIRNLAGATRETRNANVFIEWLTDYTNTVAGKTNPLDRSAQKWVGRESIQMLKKLNGRVKSNKIMGNLSSAIAQWFNIPNATLYVPSPVSWAKGMKDYVANVFANTSGTRDLIMQSDFLRQRYLDNIFDEFDPVTFKSAPKKFAADMMEFGDKQAAKMIWFSAYEDAISKGKADPIRYADEVTRKSVAGRGIGEVPIAQESELTKLFAPFQVEVSNAWYALGDAIKDKKVGGLAAWTVSSYLMNMAGQAIRGSNVSFDPLGLLIEAIAGWNDDDEDEEQKSNLRKIASLVARETGEAVSNAPFGSIVMGIISSFDKNGKLESIFGESDPTRYGVGNVGIQALFDPVIQIVSDYVNNKSVDVGSFIVDEASGIALPWGGQQVKRTYDAMKALGWIDKIERALGAENTRAPGSYTKSGNLRFVIDDSDPLNVLSALAFGQYASKEGQEYLAGGAKTLSGKKADMYQQLYDSGMDPKDAVNLLKGTTGITKSADIAEYLIEAYEDMTNDQLSEMWRATVPTNTSEYSNPFEAAANAAQYGVDTEKFLDVYSKWYDGEHQTQDSLKEILDSSGLSKAEKRGVWTAIGGMRAKPWAEKNNPYN